MEEMYKIGIISVLNTVRKIPNSRLKKKHTNKKKIGEV